MDPLINTKAILIIQGFRKIKDFDYFDTYSGNKNDIYKDAARYCSIVKS